MLRSQGWSSYCSLGVDVANLEGFLDGIFWWFTNNWCLRKPWGRVWLRKMANNIEYFISATSDNRGWRCAHKLNIIFIIRYGALVGRIQSLEADDSFETIFQAKSVESFNSMNLVRIREYLFFHKSKRQLLILSECFSQYLSLFQAKSSRN